MKTLVLGLILGFVAGYALTVRAQTISPSSSVEAFLRMEELDQMSLATGAFVALRAVMQAHREGINLAGSPRLTQCLLDPSGLLYSATSAQVRAIIARHITNNPSQWGYGLGAMTVAAIVSACPQR